MYDDISLIDLFGVPLGYLTIAGRTVLLSDIDTLKKLLTPELYQLLIDMGVPLGQLAQTGYSIVMDITLFILFILLLTFFAVRILCRHKRYTPPRRTELRHINEYDEIEEA